MLTNEFLEESADKFPDKNAVRHREQWMTYSEIEMTSNSLANFLIESGVERGDRIAILLENSFNYIISYYGVLKTGAITVELNTENEIDNLKFLQAFGPLQQGQKGALDNQIVQVQFKQFAR